VAAKEIAMNRITFHVAALSSLQMREQLAAVRRAAPKAIEPLDFALAQPKELVPKLLGLRCRALSNRGKVQAVASTVEKLSLLQRSGGQGCFQAALGFALCAQGARAINQGATPSTDASVIDGQQEARAVELLVQARASSYFNDSVNRDLFTQNPDFDVLQGRRDVIKLLEAIHGE
jgi:hypothetical protein